MALSLVRHWGNHMGRFIDLTDEQFGRLRVLRVVARNKHNQLMWECECECGVTCLALGFVLRRGEKQSCGCLKREAIASVNLSHGMTRTPIYAIYRSMMQRCYDQNSTAYNRYGARGINVCEKWQTFEGFYEDMGDKPEGMSLERKDNDGDYCPENVVWAGWKAQANNRRSNRILEHRGKSQTLTQWADEINMKPQTLHARIFRYGWPVEKALETTV
jgi:hypothetical protein